MCDHHKISKEDALRLNQKWFFTGRLCKNGHIDKRYVSTGICYECKRNLNRRQNINNCKLEVTCKKCGKIFRVPTWEKDRIYCSKKCQLDSFRPKNDIRTSSTCVICGNEFKHYGSRIVCSRKCLAEYMSQHRLNDNNPSWIKNKEVGTCKRCGKDFEYTRRDLHIGQKRVFCSLNCARNNGNNKKIDDNSNLSHRYPRSFNKILKNKIKERDGNRCLMCGETNSLHVHHIDYNKKNNENNNLVTLCKRCHNITNYNREFWTQVFIGLTSNSTIVKKGWGLEIHLVNNEKYCLKYLVFFKGKKFSWHKHPIKQELWFCLWGNLECVINTENSEYVDYFFIKRGDKIEIKPNIEHQLRATTNSLLIEVSTTDFTDDSIRIEKGD